MGRGRKAIETSGQSPARFTGQRRNPNDALILDRMSGHSRRDGGDPSASRPVLSPAVPSGPPQIPVVVADEWTLFCEGVAAICEATGRFRVIGHCGDGRKAVRMIESFRPQLALVGLDIPGLSGPAVVRECRQAGAEVKFLCIGVRSDRETVVETLRSGANGLLLKTDPATRLIEAMDHVLAGGVYLSPQVELTEVFAPRRWPSAGDPLCSLSPRESQVFALLVEGRRAKEIAVQLGLSPKTVDTYRSSLMKKLAIHDIAGLVKFAVRRKLTSLG